MIRRIFLALLAALVVGGTCACGTKPTDVGVIGSADGPTAIFITGRTS